MNSEIIQKLVHILDEKAVPLPDNDPSYIALLEKIGDSRIVLLGEATHGTREFYQARAEITQHLILKKGFMAVAIEGDWPDAYSVNRFLQETDLSQTANEALSDFKRFPAWMWRNTSVVPFLQWLRTRNDRVSDTDIKTGFYGLDLYSLNASMMAVVDYLSRTDPLAAERARKRYGCFDHLGFDPTRYGYLASEGLHISCMKEAIEQVLEFQNLSFKKVRDTAQAEEEFFYAAQNAELVKDAENYYRSMFENHEASWNIRDTHMLKTLTNLSAHLEKKFNRPAKIVVWAHNSHVGDARATEMHDRGEINIGQLVRETFGEENSYLLGFSTYQGYVTAANDWGEPADLKPINPGMPGGYEELFHRLKHKKFFLDLSDSQIRHYLQIPRLQRAIGVIYRPESERESHYYFTHLPKQFDGIIHLDETTAVEPLEITPEWQRGSLSMESS